MAGERITYAQKESIGQKAKDKTKDLALAVAEKSIYVTLPLTGVIFLAGGISGPTALLLGGADVVTSKVAGNMRKKK